MTDEKHYDIRIDFTLFYPLYRSLFAFWVSALGFRFASAQLLLDDVHHLIRQPPGSAVAEEHVAVLRDLLSLERCCPRLCASMRHRSLLVAHVGPGLREEAAPRRVAAIGASPAQCAPTHCDTLCDGATIVRERPVAHGAFTAILLALFLPQCQILWQWRLCTLSAADGLHVYVFILMAQRQAGAKCI